MPTQTIGHAQLPLDQIHTNPNQPRKQFDPGALKALQNSIGRRGLINPISVVQMPEGGYLLIAGERRYRAAQALGWKAIEARIWPVHTPPSEIELLSVVENLQRKDLNPIEEALTYKALQEPPSELGQRAIARIAGKSQATIRASIALLNEPPEIQDLIERSLISPAYIRFLTKINDISDRISWAHRTINEGWSVRDLEREISKLRGSTQSSPAQSPVAVPISTATIRDSEALPAPNSALSTDLPSSSVITTSDALNAAVQEQGPDTALPDTLASSANLPFTGSPSRPVADSPTLPDADSLTRPVAALPALPVASSPTHRLAGSTSPLPDPLKDCWNWAQELAPAGASWDASYAGTARWLFKVDLGETEPAEARTQLAHWLSAFAQRLLAEISPTTAPAPPAPQIHEATYVNGHRLLLRWTAGGEGFRYRVYRSPEDLNQWEQLGDEDLMVAGAIVNCTTDPYSSFRIAVLAIDPAGRESALSQTVRFDLNELNQNKSLEPAPPSAL